MTLVEITNILKHYAEGQFSKPTVMNGSVYENMNTSELRYPCINFENINTIKRNEEVVYSFYVYYADRLNEDGSNALEIESQATSSLQLILRNIADSSIMTLDEYYNVIITPFKMKFADMCAGAWMQLSVHALNGIDYCENGDEIKTIYITANGEYDVSEYNVANIDVQPTITGVTTITENGEYDVTNDATAIVQIDTQAYYNSGYTEGYQSGFTDGVDSVPLATTAFTSNDTYVRSEGGWNNVTVNVPSVTTQSLTQQEYDALETKDPMVIYLITE